MPRTITIGGLSDDATPHSRWTEHLALPEIPDLPVRSHLADALDYCVALRAGTVALGPKGLGKSHALARVVSRFEARERVWATADAGYRPKLLLSVGTVRATRPEDVLVLLWRELHGETPEMRARGRRKREDELREEFAYSAHEEGVCAVVVDEAEVSRRVVFDALRDLMSTAGRVYAARAGAPATGALPPAAPIPSPAGGPAADGAVRAHGIGVLLVGTALVRGRLETTSEGGQRWSKFVDLPASPPEAVPDIYRTWFRGFAPAIQAMGESAWRTFIATAVVRGKPVPMRLLSEHARDYARHYARQHPTVRSLDEVAFDRDLFRYLIDGLDSGNSRGDLP